MTNVKSYLVTRRIVPALRTWLVNTHFEVVGLGPLARSEVEAVLDVVATLQ